MENRSNYVLVGSIAVAMVVGIFLMVVWLARYSGRDAHEYDILFNQSVAGMAVGTAVAFNGVAVGKITEIRLVPDHPNQVRVRVAIDADVPILKGTTAGVEGVGFTGVSQVQLAGAMQGDDPITAIGPYGRPLIPARTGGLGELLNTAPVVLDNVVRLTERLNDILKDENRAALTGILRNADVVTASLAKSAPEIAATITEARAATAAATATLQRIEGLAGSTQRLVDSDIRPLAGDLRRTIGRTDAAIARLETLAGAAQPGVEMLAGQTIPEATALLRDLRETNARLGAIAAKLDEDPAGALLGGRRLPEYQPAERAKP